MEKTRAERAVKKIERAMADLEAGKISRYKALDIILATVNGYFEDNPISYELTDKAGGTDD
ncbi:MAG: hypothetical protein KBA08_12440 [Firmicutes bacterium]|nr:hypothetical protein [Bacillota bacterium]